MNFRDIAFILEILIECEVIRPTGEASISLNRLKKNVEKYSISEIEFQIFLRHRIRGSEDSIKIEKLLDKIYRPENNNEEYLTLHLI